jgi:hypothetical protein
MTNLNPALSHLTEDALNDFLIGTESNESAAHLASCAKCHAKLEDFQRSMEVFNMASISWSEAKSNALNRDLSQHHIPFRISSALAWACASLLILALTGTESLNLRHASNQASASGIHAADPRPGAGVDREDEIASDNALLQQIDSEISTPEPSPAEVYGASMRTGSRRVAPQVQVRD